LSSPTVSTKLRQIAEQAVRYPDCVFTTLAHLIDVDFLCEAHRLTKKSSAPGIDKVTAKDYAVNLDENLRNLHERMRSGRYKAPPVERTWLEKEDGSQRPIGKPTFEDKVVQRAVAMLLSAIYEQDFHDFSHGSRKGHSQHRALKELREQCMGINISWLVDADVRGFYDSIDHDLLRETLRKRVNDGSIIRLIGKWLNAGVMEDGNLTYPETGTPQGGVISPVLANIFLHEVLDDWFVRDVLPRMRGRCFLIRYADDFIIGCELESDARRLMDVLPKRFARFNLTIHPEKTQLVAFGKPRRRTGLTPDPRPKSGNGTFDFLGFTHYWGRSRRGYWVIMRRTSMKRVRRACRTLWRWCHDQMHQPLQWQYGKLCQKLQGHYQYYGIRGNYRLMERVYHHAKRAWRRWLSRRSTKGIIWEKFERMLEAYPLPRPRIIHQI
jgi:group II intron reverse transcriptase/maturase